MKLLIRIALIVVVAIGVIALLTPLVDEYKEQEKYAFTLNTIDGEVSKKSFEGKVLAVYFGYTYCPDVCPTTLSTLAAALDTFDKAKTQNFVGLFVSVDPDRDTLKNIKEYAQYFHPNFIAATSNKANIDEITKRYESYYEKVELENSAMGYSVSHTSYIYLFDKDGNFIERIDHFSDPQIIQKTLNKVL